MLEGEVVKEWLVFRFKGSVDLPFWRFGSEYDTLV